MVAGEGGALADLAAPEFDPASSFYSDYVEPLVSEVKNLVTSPADAVGDSNVHAFLALIRTGEGTVDAGGYSRLFGGGSFSGFADHPRVLVSMSGYNSTAAGAYQILSRTWDEIRAAYNLPDFSPASQDLAAVALIKRRGALADVVAGRFRQAIAKCSREWASLPGSPYGQPTLTLARAEQILANAGGTFEGSVLA